MTLESTDSVVLDHLLTIKPDWTDWQISHGVKLAGAIGDYCNLCKLPIVENEEYARLSNGQRIICHWHDVCLESLVKESPDLKGKLRL